MFKNRYLGLLGHQVQLNQAFLDILLEHKKFIVLESSRLSKLLRKKRI